MKTKTMHTPGPWAYSVTNEGNIGSKDKVRVEAADGHIAIACRVMRTERNTFGNVGVRRALPEVKANARLIAAAPDLLALAEELVLQFGSAQARSNPQILNALEQMARAAIAKAEGWE